MMTGLALCLAMLWPVLPNPQLTPGRIDSLPLTPNARLTPGAIAETNVQKVCVVGYSNSVRNTSAELKDRAYKEYGIEHVVKRESNGKIIPDFEVDHRVPLELGGADTLPNLWPQSYLTLRWNAHMKDRLENRIQDAVCVHHTMTLRQGQQIFLGNWIKAYRKYVLAK